MTTTDAPAWGTADSMPPVPSVDPARVAALDAAIRLRYPGKHFIGDSNPGAVLRDARVFERYLRGEAQ